MPEVKENPLRSGHLVVVHYHLRPGGVRRILELALPPLARAGRLRRVTLAVGEKADAAWTDGLAAKLGAAALQVVVVPAFRYASEQRIAPKVMRARLRAALDRVVGTEPCLIWAHNLGLARNILLSEAVAEISGRRKIPLLSHHHDFWFENRWLRRGEMRRAGVRSLDAVAERLFAAGSWSACATINRLDEAPLARRLPGRAHWLPNLAVREPAPPRNRVAGARRWLAGCLGDNAPVWIFPTRFLRRKNLAEAVLLTRWLRPEAWLVTTAGLSSPFEAAYARRLEEAARAGRWRARFRILAGQSAAPSITEIVAASEAVLLTSAQEGFGLPYLEAIASGRPLLARRLSNVVPDLEHLGFRLPYLYDELWIDSGLIDVRRERARQWEGWKKWKRSLPQSCRTMAGRPFVLTLPPDAPLPFSRLTLTAQLEVLAVDPQVSWSRCVAWNPHLKSWKQRAGAGHLQVAAWPAGAAKIIGPDAYAQRFWDAVRTIPRRPVSAAACRLAHRDFLRERLSSEFLYPILYSDQ